MNHNAAAPSWRHNSNDVIASTAQAATLAFTVINVQNISLFTLVNGNI